MSLIPGHEFKIRMGYWQGDPGPQIFTPLPNLEYTRNRVTFALESKAIACEHTLANQMEVRIEPVLDAGFFECPWNDETNVGSECRRMIEKLDRETAALSERWVADHDGGLKAIQFQEVLRCDPGILREQIVGQGARRQEIEERSAASAWLHDVSRRRGEIYSCPCFDVVNTLACNIRLRIELIEISGTRTASDQ